jgi:hypothetical protein
LSPQTADQSGETNAAGASNNGDTAGATHGFWESSFAFGDAGNPAALQPDLHVTVSPESGSGATAGARMSFVSIDDCGSAARPNPNDPNPPPSVYECDGTTPGLQVNFQDWPHAVGDFQIHHVATGLSRTQPHTVRIRMWFFEGPNNDVVQVCVDGTQCTTGHSWEDFYRDGGNGPVEPTSRVDRLLFRLHNPATGDLAQPAHQGNGLFIDNLKLASQNYSGAAFSVSGPSSLNEGTGGSNSANYNITLSEPLPFDTSVHYATANGTATAPSDYTATSATAMFPAGTTIVPVSVPITTDSTDETSETFSLSLSSPNSVGLDTGAQSFPQYAAIDTGSKTTTIVDDDSTLRVNDVTQPEGNSGTSQMVFNVTLDNPSPLTVTVHYQTVNGSAVAPSDYATKSGTLTFNPGQTSLPVSVTIKGDLTVEPDENFVLHLSAPTNSAIGDANGVGTIQNDD